MVCPRKVRFNSRGKTNADRKRSSVNTIVVSKIKENNSLVGDIETLKVICIYNYKEKKNVLGNLLGIWIKTS